jgi:hypothetical protein
MMKVSSHYEVLFFSAGIHCSLSFGSLSNEATTITHSSLSSLPQLHRRNHRLWNHFHRSLGLAHHSRYYNDLMGIHSLCLTKNSTWVTDLCRMTDVSHKEEMSGTVRKSQWVHTGPGFIHSQARDVDEPESERHMIF